MELIKSFFSRLFRRDPPLTVIPTEEDLKRKKENLARKGFIKATKGDKK